MKRSVLVVAVLGLMCSSCGPKVYKTVKADPTKAPYAPLLDKSSPGYYNTPGSQQKEVREDIAHGRKINIKSDR